MTLPVPTFFDTDAAAIEAEMVTQFEQLTGRSLQPAQAERLIIGFMAYREALVRLQGQLAAEQQLVELATYPTLDHLGKLVGVTRAAAAPASMAVTFTLVGVQPGAVVIPAGTRVAPVGSAITFTTVADCIIAAGATTGSVRAQATTSGVAGNGFAAAVLTMLDQVASVASAASTEVSGGGADLETDERLRARIKAAPASFSVAGPEGAYRYFALTASSDVLDAAVTSPTPGTVRVHLLIANGGDAAAAIALVTAALGDDVRPLSDLVEVVEATHVDFALEANVTCLRAIDADETMAAAQLAVQAVVGRLSNTLGADIVPSQIVAAIAGTSGVYDVALVSPAALLTLAPYEVAHCTGITLTLAGVVDG